MSQLEHIEAIERRLWSAADTLHANTNHASNEYFLPVISLNSLRDALVPFLNTLSAEDAHAEASEKLANFQMLRDVEGLVKLVDRAEIEANDWSLTPGRYVGIAPEEEDEDFDFREALREIHAELEGLDAEAATLAATIKHNFKALGI